MQCPACGEVMDQGDVEVVGGRSGADLSWYQFWPKPRKRRRILRSFFSRARRVALSCPHCGATYIPPNPPKRRVVLPGRPPPPDTPPRPL